MYLQLFYSDPPLTDAEKKANEQKKQNGEQVEEPAVMKEITPYVTEEEWSGNTDSASRKLSFSIVYNTPENDSIFTPLTLKLGGFIYAYYTEDDASQSQIQIFAGRIFFIKRNTSGYVFEYVAYDDMIFLAKSKVQKKFDNITVSDAIKQVCSDIGIPVADTMPALPTVVNFIADGKSCTEVFKTLSEKSKADTTNGSVEFLVMCNWDKVTVVKKGETVSDYVATDYANIIHTEHSQSIENMVNRVIAVDEVGKVCQVFTIDDDVTHYGMLQDVYKMQPPKIGETVDNAKAAKSRLQEIKEDSSLEGVGNIQCVTGYAITIQEQQLKGTFYIKADTHKFSGNTHTMSLTLEYLPTEKIEPTITEQDLATPIFKSSGKGNKKSYNSTSGDGNMDVDSGMKAGEAAWLGVRMDNGSEGCVEAVGKVGSYHSQFLVQECNNGVVNVEQICSDAGENVIPFDESQLEGGDVVVYGNRDHVVLYDGNGGYVGNSSSQQQVVHGSSIYEMDNLKPTEIIKTSRF